MSLEIAFRPAVGSDIAYIKNTWLESFRTTGDGIRGMPNSYFFHYENLMLRKTLPRCSNKGGLVVAYAFRPDMEFQETIEADILGWICAEPLEDERGMDKSLFVHYVYTRGHDSRRNKNIEGQTGNYRRQGVATALLRHVQKTMMREGEPIFYSYRTSACWMKPEARETLKREGATYVKHMRFTLAPPGWDSVGRPVS